MDSKGKQRRRGREATVAAILDVAERLFSRRGYDAVTVRDIANGAGVSHPLVHQYVGRKADVLRAVLARNAGLVLAAAPDDPDLLESAGLMVRQALTPEGRTHLRLVLRSALNGRAYDRTPGTFAATERLMALAEGRAETAADGERDVDARIAVACVVSVLLGWTGAESWIRPATGLENVDETALIDGVVGVVVGILRDNVPGADRDH